MANLTIFSYLCHPLQKITDMAEDIVLTPMMKQFLELKAKHPDAILLFRCGDFYETYSTDAIVASDILGITLTKRANGKDKQLEMAGFPYHALDTYLPKLVRTGRRVAICDQLEDPKLTKKLVKRGITELVTPGVSINENVLNYKENNFLAAVHFGKGTCGVSFLDISTGEFLTAEGPFNYIDKLLVNFAPKEILFQRGLRSQFEANFGSKYCTFELDDWAFTESFARDKLIKHFQVKNLKGFGIDHLKNGVISHIETSGLRGELAEQISRGLMEFPIVFRSHGGRAAAIDSGELHIDVAFLGAPSCDPYGNANGYSRDDDDSILCGSMGYAVPDATHADKVVVLTNNLVKYPNMPCAIPEHQVDYIVVIDDIGDPKGIMSGATRYTKNPKELLIAQTAAQVIDAAGYFYDGFSMQMGSGGASLAAARFLRQMMIDKGIKCRFALGGITGQIASMHEEGLVERILDVQSFDLDAAQSLKKNFDHHQISATYYASFLQDAAVDQLDFVILSALEIDTDFNVNVLTGSDGVIRGAIGGHPDTAAGASLSVVVAPLTRGRIPSIIDKVNTIVTPGATVDVVVTDQGVAVNPNRPEVAEKLKAAGVKVYTIEQLKAKAEAIVGKPEPIRYKDNIVGVVMYRDNTVIDVIRQIEE